MAAKQEFESRFAKHKDELEWLFMELYHNREGLEVLEREMAEAYNARSAELKALDKARSADPEWYKRGNMFGMTMYTDLFAGNLKELAKKLPYLKEHMAGICEVRSSFLSSCNICRPLFTGIMISVIIISGRSEKAFFNPTSPLSASTDRYAS